jgi:flagellar biosynthesis anti-sigma factor FlgM
MKISQKGPADTDVSKAIHNDKSVRAAKRDGEAKVQQGAESATVNISEAARKLQRIAELAKQGDLARAEKVQRIKAQIDAGVYQPDAKEISKSILRSEVARLMGEDQD